VRAVSAGASDQDVRTLLGGFGFSGDAVEKTVDVLSGGEKIRLALARLLIDPPNLLVLDEPTTHLDIQARESLERALHDFQGTLCLVSHDIDFVRHVGTGILAMTPPGVTRYAGGYDYYHEKVISDQSSAISGQKSDVGKKQLEGKRPREPSFATRDTPSAPPDKKEIRRQRAAAREALYEKTKDLKKTIHKAEKEVERLEAENAELTEQLSAPTQKADFASLSRRMKEIQCEIDIATGKWEEATAALEKVVGESADTANP
jgi:ATP-binding cassette subfamily F protein 3